MSIEHGIYVLCTALPKNTGTGFDQSYLAATLSKPRTVILQGIHNASPDDSIRSFVAADGTSTGTGNVSSLVGGCAIETVAGPYS